MLLKPPIPNEFHILVPLHDQSQVKEKGADRIIDGVGYIWERTDEETFLAYTGPKVARMRGCSICGHQNCDPYRDHV
jgi:hypothetical protein